MTGDRIVEPSVKYRGIRAALSSLKLFSFSSSSTRLSDLLKALNKQSLKELLTCRKNVKERRGRGEEKETETNEFFPSKCIRK